MRSDSTRRRRGRRVLSWALAAATAVTIGGGLALSAPATAAGCDGVWRVTTGKTPAGSQVRALIPVSARELWAAGAMVRSGTGFVSRSRAGTLTTMRLPELMFVNRLAGTSRDMYAVGPALTTFADQLYHYDGTRWTEVPGLTEVLGEFGSINAMEVRDGVLYAFAVRFNQAGAITLALTWDGKRWTALPHNLADSAYAVPLASALSPSGEVWVAGEDVLFTQDHPIWRKPWVGKVVGAKVVRQPAPRIPQLTSTMPTTITFDSSGAPVVSGWTGEDWVTGLYPFSATQRAGGGWRLDTIPAPVAQMTTVSDSATVGGRVHTSSWATILDQEWLSLSARGAKGFGNPVNLAGHAGEMPFAMAGLPTGEGYLAGRIAGDTTRLWTVCGSGSRPDGAGDTGAEAGGAQAGAAPTDGARADAGGAATGPASGREAKAGAGTWTMPPLATRVATARQARAEHDLTAIDGLVARSARTAMRTGATLSGPAIDRLRTATRASAAAQFVARNACADAPGQMRCLAQVVTRRTANGHRYPVTGYPAGYGPTEYRAAYGLPARGGNGKTVGIAIAFHHPNLPADLAIYRQAAGLPPCTKANGCLRVVGQSGGNPPATVDDGWALEAALDAQTVSAACPDCKILLVEADSAYDSDLGQANQTAARLGAWVVSNSFGRDELTTDGQTAGQMLPGSVPLVAANGDWGHGAIYPSTIPPVVGVGGTRLLEAPGSPRGWQESVWTFSGGGCSAVQPRPTWQRAANCFGAKAATTSLAAVADPATGAAVYFTPQDPTHPAGWYVVGGTSLSAPLVAGMAAVTGTRLSDKAIWSHGSSALDIRTGGRTGWCSPAWECTGTHGYDAVTGFGIPRW